MTVTNREAENWIKVQSLAAQKKAQAERLKLVMAVMKPVQKQIPL